MEMLSAAKVCFGNLWRVLLAVTTVGALLAVSGWELGGAKHPAMLGIEDGACVPHRLQMPC